MSGLGERLTEDKLMMWGWEPRRRPDSYPNISRRVCREDEAVAGRRSHVSARYRWAGETGWADTKLGPPSRITELLKTPTVEQFPHRPYWWTCPVNRSSSFPQCLRQSL